MMTLQELASILIEKYPDIEMRALAKSSFVFEERVKHKCFHCKNYNVKWTCPPRLPNVDYRKLFEEYSHVAVLIAKTSIQDVDLMVAREKSTNTIHKALLYLEKVLYQHNNSMALSFIGGSCKLCKNGCNKEKCANPQLSRVPWEATGCNVVATLAKNGIDVVFPISNYLYRYGLLLW